MWQEIVRGVVKSKRPITEIPLFGRTRATVTSSLRTAARALGKRVSVSTYDGKVFIVVGGGWRKKRRKA